MPLPTWEQFAADHADVSERILRGIYQQAQMMEEARQRHAGNSEPADRYIARRAIPLASTAMNLLESSSHHAATARVAAGTATYGDFDTVARRELDDRAARNRSIPEEIVSGVAHVPAMVGEAVMGGALLRGATAVPYLGGALGAIGVGAEAAPIVSATGGFSARAAASNLPGMLGRNAAQTAVMPSMWAPQWSEANTRAGRDPFDVRALPSAYTMGFLNTAVLGSLGSWSGIGKTALTRQGVYGASQRILARTGAGMLEQQGVDVLASAVSEFLPEVCKLETGYGLIGHVIHGVKKNDWDPLFRHGLTQAVTFGAFAVLHGMHDPHEMAKDLKDTLDRAKDEGLSQEQAGKMLEQMANAANPERQPAAPVAPAQQAPVPGGPRPMAEPTQQPSFMRQPAVPEPRAAERPVAPAQPPEARTGQNMGVPGLSKGSVFERMPLEVLEKQAKYGVQGAKDELARRQSPQETVPAEPALAEQIVPVPPKVELTPAQREAAIAELSASQAADMKRQEAGQAEPRKRTYGPNDLEPETQRMIDEHTLHADPKLDRRMKDSLEFYLSGGSLREAKKQIGVSHEQVRQDANKAFKRLKAENPSFLPEFDSINQYRSELRIREILKLTEAGEGVSEADLGNVEEGKGKQAKGSKYNLLDALANAEEDLSIYAKEIESDKKRAQSIGNQTERSREDVSRRLEEALAESLDVAKAQISSREAKGSQGQAVAPPGPIPGLEGENRGARPPGPGQPEPVAKTGTVAERMPLVESRPIGGTMGTGPQVAVESTKNIALAKEKVKETRLEEGLAEIIKQAPQADKMIWEDARQAVQNNPGAATRLAQEVVDTNGQRALNTTEKAMILHRMIAVRNELSAAVKASLGGEAMSMSDMAYMRLQKRVAELKAEREIVDKASDLAGSESGRSLRIQRLLAKYDYSLDGLLRSAESAKRAPLTEGETRKFTELQAKIDELQNKLDAKETGRRSEPTEKSKATGNLAQRLAKEAVEKGIVEREQVIDYVHEKINELGHDLDRRETMDAISGYGKYTLLNKEEVAATLRDLKGQMQQLGKLEDMAAGQAPLKTGGERRVPSAEERALIKEVNEAKKKGGYDVLDPDKQLKTALDSVKTRLRNQIEDIQRSIDSREPIVKEKSGLAYDAEAETLRAQRDALKDQYDSIFGKKEMTEEQRLRIAMDAVGDSMAEWNRRIKEMDFSTREGGPKASSPELEAMRSRRDALREEFRGLKDAADKNMERPPELIRNQAYKTATMQKIAELQDRIARGDFERPAKKPQIELNKENTALKAELEKTRKEVNEGIARLEAEHRPAWEKAAAIVTKWHRGFLLSAPTVLAKLSSAAVWRTIISPMENAVIAKGIGLAFPKLAEKAIYEGPTSASLEARAFAEGFKRVFEDAKSVMKTGEMDIGHAFGKEKLDVDPSFMDYIGRVHAALKTVPKRAAFFRAMEQGAEAAIKQGLDVHDPAVQTRLSVEAYKQAERAISQQNNWLTDSWKRFLSKTTDPFTGKETTGSVVRRTIGDNLLPIVKVPTNIAFEVFQHVFGTITGGARLARAYANGIESLRPEQADVIFRELKKGILGSAVMALGLYFKDDVGGLYQRNDHRDDKQPGFGEVKLFGVKIPAVVLHNPLVEALQVGASAGRLMEQGTRNGPRGFSESLGLAVLGLADEIPFVREMTHVSELAHGHPGGFVGNQAKSFLVPQAVDWTARMTDRDSQGNLIRRRPDGIWETIKSGIPGLRRGLPAR